MRSIVFSALLLSAPALADDTDTGVEKPKNDASETVEAGNFLPLGVSPKTPTSHAQMVGGYDTARGGALVMTQLQARLHKRFYLIVAGTYEGPSDTTLEPSVMGQGIVLDEKSQGLDLAVQGGWEHQGFNQVPAVVGRVAVGKHVGGAYVLASSAVGFGTSDNERYGELTLGGVGEVLPKLYAGLDARGRMDLQHETDPSTEDAWDVQAGPVATYAAGPVAVTAMAGVSALQQHVSPSDKVGAITMLGLGAVF